MVLIHGVLLCELLAMSIRTKIKNACQQTCDLMFRQEEGRALQPKLDQVDVLEASVSELVNTAQLLEEYAKRIGVRRP